MALIKCSECNKEISDQAPACPNCGKPTRPRTVAAVLIELTSKKWKRIKLIAWISIIVSFFIFMNGLGNGGFNNPITGVGLTCGFASVIMLFVGKFGAWWHH